jgi:YggT family protein
MADFISYVLNILSLIVVVRALFSFVDPGYRSAIGRVLFDITEPFLGPIRRYVPPFGGLDLSPIILILLIQVARRILVEAAG